MRLKSVSTLLLLLVLALPLVRPAAAQSAPQPANPHASPEARALLKTLNDLSGKGIVTGQHNYPATLARWTDMAYDLTGKYPGLWGEDFGFTNGDDKDSILSRPAMVAEAKRQYKNGSLIALTWHEVRPSDDEPTTWHESIQGHLTDYEWHELLTPGSPLNKRWCDQVDVVAGYLAQLRDAHIPVLFRPYHEINGNWFWWTGRPGKDGSAALYRMIYDRFVNVHHLDNLVWVWNVNAPNPDWVPISQYYPGPEFVDVVTMDIYGEYKQEFYDSMVTLAAGKPIALAEVGGLPSLNVLEKQPRWVYFMVWSEFIQDANPLELSNAVFHSPHSINRDDARLAMPLAAIRKATDARAEATATPVTPNASQSVKALLTRLTATSGKGIFSGQKYDASASVPAAGVQRPAIYGAELGATTVNRGAIIKSALEAHTGKAEVALSWRPARPTDNAAAKAPGGLSDFEWNELLTSGSVLNQRWLAQEDELAADLAELDKAGVAVLFDPLPEASGKDFWWAGRKGVHGSLELYRQLFDRLVNHDGLHNLVWIWEAAAPDFRPGIEPTQPGDYFPGLLYVDAVEARLNRLDGRFPASRMLQPLAVGKPIGVEFSGEIPAPEALTGNAGWSWFLADPAPDSPTRSEALRKLYADPGVVSLPAAQ